MPLCAAGVIENDFHPRTDLTPSVGAVYVEEKYHCRGIAGDLIGKACCNMHKTERDALYLLTDNDSFYERYGCEFLCPVQGDGVRYLSRDVRTQIQQVSGR